MKNPAYQEKANAGPVGILVIHPTGTGPSPKQLGLHFVYALTISVFAAYISGTTLPHGVAYLKVFQIAGATAFLGHSGALFLNSIWYGFSWSLTVKHCVDGLVYGLLTAGVFGWLWSA